MVKDLLPVFFNLPFDRDIFWGRVRGVGGGGGGRGGGGGLVDEEEGVGRDGGDGGGAGVGVARLLLVELVDVVGADVGAPRLLPFPRALRRLPHRRRLLARSLAPPPRGSGRGLGGRRGSY